ncbi:Phage protein [Bacillus thuringiensis MC28]|nr:Phage protein [Bacillus thuringiensis MC28]
MEERITQAEDWEEKRQMMAQVNYYRGNQWLVWNPTSKKMITAPLENGEQRITVNQIRPRMMVKLAKQIKNRVKFDVIPDSNDETRIEIAKAASKFLKYWWEQTGMDRKTRDIFLNNGIKGWCATKVYFDAETGQDITPQEGEIGFEEDMQNLYTGEIRCRICDPLTVYIDPAAEMDEEIRWIVERKPRDIDYIKERYGKDVAADENVGFAATFDVTPQNGCNSTSKKRPNMAMVDEMWIKPCGTHPNGLKVTIAGGQLLDMDDNAGDIPFFIFGDIPIPGSVKAEAFIKDMLPIQREINIIRSMFATHARKMGNSMWLVPMGSSVDEDEITNEEGGILHYTPIEGARPERVPPPDIPSFYDRILNNHDADIDDLSGAREISQGRLPAGLDTYSGLSLMVEQENEKLAVSSQNYEYGMKRLLQRVLMLMKKHYTEERMARILGPDNDIELVSFTGSDLSGGEDINIIQGSSLPEMKSAQQDRIMTMWDKGAIVKKDGSPDTQAFLKLMGMGDSNELFEMQQLDENKAKMENKQFQQIAQQPESLQALQLYTMQQQQFQDQVQAMQVQGVDPMQAGMQPPQLPLVTPQVRDFYDHDVHVYIHNSFRKSSLYDELPPEVQQLVDEHVQQHMEALNAPMEADKQQQMEQEQQMQEEQRAMKEQDLQLQHRKLDIEEKKVEK